MTDEEITDEASSTYFVDYLDLPEYARDMFQRALELSAEKTHDHEWVDASNKVVKGGFVCVKCHAFKA